MTIEQLLKVLQPFYAAWNEEQSKLYLRAVRGPVIVYAEITDHDGTEIGVQSSSPEAWTLGIDTATFRKESTIEIAQIIVDADDRVTKIEPHLIAQFQHLGPLLRAVAVVEELRPLVQ